MNDIFTFVFKKWWWQRRKQKKEFIESLKGCEVSWLNEIYYVGSSLGSIMVRREKEEYYVFGSPFSFSKKERYEIWVIFVNNLVIDESKPHPPLLRIVPDKPKFPGGRIRKEGSSKWRESLNHGDEK